MEVWKPIPGVPRYEVSDQGNIRHHKRKQQLKLCEDRKGYLVFYYRPIPFGRRKKMFAHKAVALAFLPDPPFEGCTIDHIAGCRQDNRAHQLRWATIQEQNINRETTFRRRTWSGEPDAETGHAVTGAQASPEEAGSYDGTFEEI